MMTRNEYLDSLMEARQNGRISEDAFWQGIENADIFSYDDDEEKE